MSSLPCEFSQQEMSKPRLSQISLDVRASGVHPNVNQCCSVIYFNFATTCQLTRCLRLFFSGSIDLGGSSLVISQLEGWRRQGSWRSDPPSLSCSVKPISLGILIRKKKIIISLIWSKFAHLFPWWCAAWGGFIEGLRQNFEYTDRVGIEKKLFLMTDLFLLLLLSLLY